MIPHDPMSWLTISLRFESSGLQALVSWTLIIRRGLLLVEAMYIFSLLELLHLLLDESKFCFLGNPQTQDLLRTG